MSQLFELLFSCLRT